MEEALLLFNRKSGTLLRQLRHALNRKGNEAEWRPSRAMPWKREMIEWRNDFESFSSRWITRLQYLVATA